MDESFPNIGNLALTLFVVASIGGLTSCRDVQCNKSRSTQIVMKNIDDEGKNSAEYSIVFYKKDRTQVYIGASERSNPTYLRHYKIDSSCKIVDLMIDQ